MEVASQLQSQRRPLRRDAELKRARIIEAARRLIAERGLAISHDEIARAADVGVGTVYRRFPTLPALFQEIFAGRVAEVLQLLDQAEQIPDAWGGLRSFIVGNCELQSRHRGLQQFLTSGAGAVDYVAQARARLAPRVAALLARAQAAGQVRPDLHASDIALVFALTGVMIDAARGVDPELWRRYLALLLDGFTPGLPSPTLPGAPPEGARLDEVLSRWGRA